MKNDISIHRIVPNIYSNNLEASKEFYLNFLNMELLMDLGWILTFGSRENPTAQINIFKSEESENQDKQSVFLSVEVSDIDKMYERAKRQNCNIVYELTVERWGVKRFFVKDPNGATINLLEHQK